LGQFDVVFCRNVLIYFDRPTKKSILERMAHLMPSDGRLFLGAAETVVGLTPVFQAVTGKRGLYEVSAGGDATLKRTGTFGT
ncbi:MAG: CheR family methyltransferase, partial [Pseudomonadota bacterium]